MPTKKNKLKTTKEKNLAEKTERILFTMPSMIARQIGKDHQNLKTQEKQLQNDLKKGDAEKKKLMLQLAALKKKTSPNKNQVLKTQKKLKQSLNVSNTLMRSIELARKQALALSEKQKKYNALHTQLVKFEKEWEAHAKKANKSKPKAKLKMKKKSSANLVVNKPANEPNLNYSSEMTSQTVTEIDTGSSTEGNNLN